MGTSLILCRCEGVTAERIETVIKELGAGSVNEVKKLTRAGMGPCQGRTCSCLIQAALATAGAPGADEPFTARPPIRPVPLGVLAQGAAHFEEPSGALNGKVLWGRSKGGSTTSLNPEGER